MPDFQKELDSAHDEHEQYMVAERHARLLQQIWEWATVDPIHFRNDAKAHVRSLLVGQQEAK